MTEKTAEEYKEKYFEEKFDNINEKLDDIKELVGMKASSNSVLRLEGRVSDIERSHIPCATVVIVKKQLEDLELKIKPVIEASEGPIFFNKHPTMLKIVIAGVIFCIIIGAVGLVPSWIMWKRWKIDEAKLIKTEQVDFQKAKEEQKK